MAPILKTDINTNWVSARPH